MRRTIEPLWCLLLLSAVRLGYGGSITVDGTGFTPICEAKHPTYTLRFTVSAPRQRPRRLTLLFASQDPQNHYRLRLLPGRAMLDLTEAGKTRTLAENRGSFLADAPEQQLLIKRHKRSVYAIVNGVIAVHALDSTLRGGTVWIEKAPNLKVSGLRCQPTGDVLLADDFMRTEEEGADLGAWAPVSGQWRLHSVMEEIRKTTAVAKGREPQAERSANPFSLSSTGPGASLVVTGQWFWDDYAVAVSAKTHGGRFGLVFAYQDAQDYFFLRWQLTYPMTHARTAQLVRVTPDGEQVLAERVVEGRAGSWYRLHASMFGGRIRAGLDDTVLFDVLDDRCIGGQVGLYSDSAGATYFDDVSVRSERPLNFSHERLLSRHGSSVVGKWGIDGSKQGTTLLSQERGAAVFAIGDRRWPGCLIQARAKPGDHIGLVFGLQDAGTYCVCRLSRQRAELVRVTGEREEVALSVPTDARTDDWTELALDLTTSGCLKFYVGDVLEIRDTRFIVPAGKPGLYATGGGSFKDIRLFGELQRDWQRTIERREFVDDPYMQSWASPKWAWTAIAPATYVYNGDVYGALRLAAPIVDSATFFFGTAAGEPNAGYSVAIDLNREQKRCGLALRRKGQAVATADVAVSPVKPTKPDPYHPSPPTWGTLTVEQDGRYVLLSVDGKELVCFRDASPCRGLDLGLATAAPVDFSQVTVMRDRVKDYPFEKAPVGWEGAGSWEVANRFGRGYFRTTHKSIIHNVLAFVNHEEGEAKPGVINRVGRYPWVLVVFLLELRLGLSGSFAGSSCIFVPFGRRREIASICC